MTGDGVRKARGGCCKLGEPDRLYSAHSASQTLLKNLKTGKLSYKKPDSRNLSKHWKSGNTDGVEGLSF